MSKKRSRMNTLERTVKLCEHGKVARAEKSEQLASTPQGR